ncbi:MAG: hypothetical protein HON90_17730 [Halobacteriovoraceae bacterium]|nr:hypothetical protein [Halobacteriovoraceae bacterium]
MKKMFLLLLSIGITSCLGQGGGGGGSTPPTSSNALVETYAGVSAQTKKIGGLAPTSLTIANSQVEKGWRMSKSTSALVAFGNDWDVNQTLPDDSTEANDQITAKEWMGQQINEKAVRENGSDISVFGRMNSTLGVFCAIGVILGTDVDANGYPSDGSKSVTFAASHITTIKSECNFDASSASGMTMNFTVSTPTNTTVFDKKVVLNPPGGGIQTVYFRNSTSEINVTSVETYTKESKNWVSRTVVDYDKSTKIIRAEYISGQAGTLANGDRVQVSRILYDEPNDEGYLMYMAYEKDTTDYSREYVLTGKPQTASSEFALSFYDDQALNDTDERQLCVNSDTGDMASGATDGVFCSAVSGKSIAGISISSASVFTSLKSGYDGANYNTISETTALSFTAANFVTTAFSTN